MIGYWTPSRRDGPWVLPFGELQKKDKYICKYKFVLYLCPQKQSNTKHYEHLNTRI